MSYSISTTGTREEVTAAIEAMTQPSPEGIDSALADLKTAALAVLGAVGTPADAMRVSISGHVNPDHALGVGWSDEFTNISISVVRP